MALSSATAGLAENVDKIDISLSSFAFCAKVFCEPGGATNASPGSDHNAAEKEQAHG